MHATAFLGDCWLEATFMFGCVCVSLPKVATPGRIPRVECVKTCWMRKHARPERRQEKQNTDLGLSLGSFEYVEGESRTGKVANRERKLAFGGAVPCRVNTAQCSPAAAEGFCLSSKSLIYQWARFVFFILSIIYWIKHTLVRKTCLSWASVSLTDPWIWRTGGKPPENGRTLEVLCMGFPGDLG